MPILETTKTMATTLASLEGTTTTQVPALGATSTPAATATAVVAAVNDNANNDYLLQQHHQQHQQQHQHQQQQFNNQHYYQHATSQSPLLAAQQHPVAALAAATIATTTAAATAATASSLATYNGNLNLNSSFANGNNNISSNNNNKNNDNCNSRNDNNHSIGSSSSSSNIIGSNNIGNGLVTSILHKSEHAAAVATTTPTTTAAESATGGGSIVGISTTTSVVKKSNLIGAPPPLTAATAVQQLQASREDVASLGGASSINSQMSSSAANSNHNHSNNNSNNYNHNKNNNNTISISNGIVHHNHNGNNIIIGAAAAPTAGAATRNPSGILKGSKENLLQNYYNGDVGVSVAGNGNGGGSSIGSESGIIGGSNGAHLENDDPGDGLGPLPPKWETAYTERGELYFIDHNTGTSHWLDPRLSKFQKKSLEDCCEDELPYGWEKIQDSLYGTYYIDHVNRRTQYENPVLEAKRRAAEQKQNQQQQQQQQHQLQHQHQHQHQQRAKTPTKLNTTTTATLHGLNAGLSSNSLDMSLRAMQPPPPLPLQASNELLAGVGDKTLLPYKFTRNSAELQGERLSTTLIKSARGLGITIVGGDNNSEAIGVDEFLQIKSIVPNGPAWLDGQLQTGDVLVYVNDTCVLGFTHHEMVNIFQSILPGEAATLEICRGYPLPFDPNDPNTEVVTTIAVDGISSEPEKQRRILMDLNMDGNYNFLDVSGDGTGTGTGTAKAKATANGGHLDGGVSQFILMKKPEVHTFAIVKGPMGFGFTIADSSGGQKVKKILDRNCCNQLLEGDVLLEINDINVRTKTHVEVVQVLKECSKIAPTNVKIQRVPTGITGAGATAVGFNNVTKLRKNFVGGTAALTGGGLFRSKTPTADLYSTQQKEVLPMRPKTPLVDTRRNRVKTPDNEVNDTLVSLGKDVEERTLAESTSQVDGKSNNSLQDIDEIPYMDPYPKLMSRLSERLADATLGESSGVGVAGGLTGPGAGLTGGGSAIAGGYTNVLGNAATGGGHYARAAANYENQEYVSAASQHSGAGGGGGGSGAGVGGLSNNNYNPIYGMTTMPPSMHPLNHHGNTVAGNIYVPNTMPPSMLAAGNSLANQLHHESCFCYECQDLRQQHKYRLPPNVAQTSPQQMATMGGYYNPSGALPQLSPADATGTGVHPHAHAAQQYSPLAGNGTGGGSSTLQAAHIQNERMQKRVNELLQDRRRVGFSPLDGHSMAHHHHQLQQQQQQQQQQQHHQLTPVQQQQHSPAVSSISQQTAAANWTPGVAHHMACYNHTVGQTNVSGTLRNGNGIGIAGLLDVSEDADQYELTEVTLDRQALGFGFRIVGGTEEGSQVTVGHIVPGGAADNDQRIATGDEILSIDGINVVNSSHHKVVSLVGESALRGQVTMILRRHVRGNLPQPPNMLCRYPYDVIVGRSEQEGFGFVIISSSNQYYGSTIGKLINGSPADRCGELKVGDRIIAVNRIDIAGMSHGEVVNLIKESGLHVRLTIGCPIKETASPGGGAGSHTPLQMNAANHTASQASPVQQQQQQQQHQQHQQLNQPAAPALLTQAMNGLAQQHQQPSKTDIPSSYMERPGTSVSAALSLHHQPQL